MSEIFYIPSHINLEDKSVVDFTKEEGKEPEIQEPSKDEVIAKCISEIRNQLRKGDQLFYDKFHTFVNDTFCYKTYKIDKKYRYILTTIKKNHKIMEDISFILRQRNDDYNLKLKNVKKAYAIFKKYDRAFTEFNNLVVN